MRSRLALFATLVIVSACSSFETTTLPDAGALDAGSGDGVAPESGPFDAGSTSPKCKGTSLQCDDFEGDFSKWTTSSTQPVLVPGPTGKAMRAQVEAGMGSSITVVQKLLATSHRVEIAFDFRAIDPKAAAGTDLSYAILSVGFSGVDGGVVTFANLMLSPSETPGSTRLQLQAVTPGFGVGTVNSKILAVPYDGWHTLTFQIDFGTTGSYRLDVSGVGSVEDVLPSLDGEPGLSLGVLRYAGASPSLSVEFDNFVAD